MEGSGARSFDWSRATGCEGGREVLICTRGPPWSRDIERDRRPLEKRVRLAGRVCDVRARMSIETPCARVTSRHEALLDRATLQGRVVGG